MGLLDDLFRRIVKLIERLLGHKRPSPREVLQRHGRQVQTPQPSQQPTRQPPTNNPPYQTPIEPPIEPPTPEDFVLDINDAEALKRYVSKLEDLSAFERFKSSLGWLSTHLDRVTKELRKLDTPPDFDEDFNFKLAKKVRDISKHMLNIFRDAKSSGALDERTRIELTALVEDYLANIGVTKKIFHVGDNSNAWANLGMEASLELIATRDRDKDSTIAAIEVYPHEIRYRNENGDVDQMTFGGLCKVYKFKEV